MAHITKIICYNTTKKSITILEINCMAHITKIICSSSQSGWLLQNIHMISQMTMDLLLFL